MRAQGWMQPSSLMPLGKRVLGICGGLQMLGEALIDLHGVDGNAAGLGLLPLATLFAQDKTVQPTTLQLPALQAPWNALSDVPTRGYEIHHGQTQLRADMQMASMRPAQELLPGMLWQEATALSSVPICTACLKTPR
jgi:adenosylcobyric acid synthase